MKPPEINNVNDIFDENARYRAPVFQRFYVWGKDQFDLLAEDIETADPNTGQFLGAIVVEDLGRSQGPASPTEYLLIDGQQRLTTFYLLFMALAAIARENHDFDSADFIVNNYLTDAKSRRYSGWPKLVPTLQDRAALWNLLNEFLPEVEWNFQQDRAEDKVSSSDRITAQFRRIVEHYRKFFKDADGTFVQDAFDRTLRSLQENLKLIVITLEQTDDANAIFSRLNAEGVPLVLADLVRNEVLSKFDDADKAERFYLNEWQPFEKQFSGRSLDQFSPIYAQIISKGQVTKSTSFGYLQEKWKGIPPQQILKRLEEYAPYFSRLVEYDRHPSLDAGLNAAVERFSRMPRTTVTWPFLLQVLNAVEKNQLTSAQAVRAFRIVESFLVRRSIIGIEPTGLHSVFKTLWEKTKGNESSVLQNIVSRTIKVPSDLDILNALRNDAADTRVILPYVFEERENEFTRRNKYDRALTASTIEHVLPKHLSSSWSASISKEDHKSHFGLIGNLAALSEKQNKSLQDDSWEQKRKRFKGSDFKLTQELAKRRVWNTGVIEFRTNELASWIVQRWPSLENL